MISKLSEKLQDPEYRKAFVASQISIGVPFQIRALLKARGWTQEQLAERAGMLQPRISGIMTPGKTHPNIETLRRLAEAFDCGLMVRFAPFGELARWSEEFDPDFFSVPDFYNDAEFIEPKELKATTVNAAVNSYLEGITNGASMSQDHPMTTHLRDWERSGKVIRDLWTAWRWIAPAFDSCVGAQGAIRSPYPRMQDLVFANVKLTANATGRKPAQQTKKAAGAEVVDISTYIKRTTLSAAVVAGAMNQKLKRGRKPSGRGRKSA